MRILLTGGTGLLGYALLQSKSPDIEVMSVYNPSEDPLKYELPGSSRALDVSNLSKITALFKEFKPEAIIHTAAQGSLDWCEENKREAYAVNVTSTKNIINLCSKYGAHFVFMSSNAVYAGDHGPYNEKVTPKPVNHYGEMKVAVEDFLKSQDVSFTVLRPNLMYGWPCPGGRDNQVTRVISSLRAKEPINIVSDTYFSPLSTTFMATVTWHVATNMIKGTYNIGGANRMNLFELSEKTAKVFSLDASLLSPISHKDTQAAAKRAIDTSFDCSLMQRELKFEPLSVEEGLEGMKERGSK